MKNGITSLAISVFVALLRAIHRPTRQKIIFAIATIILKLAPKTRDRAIQNVKRAMPLLSDDSIESLVCKSYKNIVFGVTECFWLDELKLDIECSEDTLRLLHSPKGCSICTMHMSCVEVAPLAIQKLVGEITTLSKIPRVLKGKHSIYRRANINVIDKADTDSLFRLLEATRAGSPICLHGDHYASDVDITFFGQTTQAPSGPAMLSAYGKVPLLLCYAVLQDNGHYKVFIETIVASHVLNTKVDVRNAVEEMYRCFERVIAKYPEQWCWSYKRWRDLKQ